MTENYLLPYKFKKIGIWLFFPFLALSLWVLLSGELEFDYLQWPSLAFLYNGFDEGLKLFSVHITDPINEFAMFGLLLSMCLIGLSKEKDEDEMTSLIRARSFVWSFWVTAGILAFGIIFIYGTAFMEFSFAAIFLIFLVYIIKFNVSMHALRRSGK